MKIVSIKSVNWFWATPLIIEVINEQHYWAFICQLDRNLTVKAH